MKRYLYKYLAVTFALFGAVSVAFSQNTVSGTVKDANGEPIIGASVYVDGEQSSGRVTDIDGKFTLSTNATPPFNLTVSFAGSSQQISVTSFSSPLNITFESTLELVELLVSGDPLRPLGDLGPTTKSIGATEIAAAASPDPYTLLNVSVPGVNLVTQSLTFQSVNVRGFGSNGNTRLVQLIDGVDNQAPGLNFPVGNAVGISELDLANIELIQGPASAVYGPNALNGTLLMTSKSPFDERYQGLSVYSKLGVNHVDNRDKDMALYSDFGIRYAKKVSDKLAFKVVGSYLKASDFIGVDENYYNRNGYVLANSRAANARVYDGINVYGDNVLNLGSIADGVIAGDPNSSLVAVRSLIPNGEDGNFSPLGYAERDFVDNTTESMKTAVALHYKLSDNLELVGQFNYGLGSSVYTANDRFILDNFSIWTGRVQLNGKKGFLRAYTTQENSGDSYAANTLSQLMLAYSDEDFNSYIPTYLETFVGARLYGANIEQAHTAARGAAELARPQVGDANYNRLYNELRQIGIPQGAKFLDKSDLWHYEGRYNIMPEDSDLQILVGGNFRQYRLNSEGTLFALDDDGNEITINEYGGFAQLTYNINDKIYLTGSGRFDKNENFEGQFSPRLSGLYEINDNLMLRASYTTGFRIPTTQNQFINLDVVSSRLIGRDQMLTDRYGFNTNPVYTEADVLAARQRFANGEDAATIAADLNPFTIEPFRPEKVSSFEAGFRAKMFDQNLSIDAFAYFSRFTDYIVAIRYYQTDDDNNGLTPNPEASEDDPEGIISQSKDTQVYGSNFNASGAIDTQGFGIDANYIVNNNIRIFGNTSYNELVDDSDLQEQGFEAEYNTPKWRHNAGISYSKDNLGASVNYRWQDAYLWQSAIGVGPVEGFGTVDAAFTYKIENMGTLLKIGGSNILNRRYVSSFANPSIGAIYYIQLTFDESIFKSNR